MSIEAMKKALDALESTHVHPLNDAQQYQKEVDAMEVLVNAIEQAEKDKARFDDFVGQLQEVEKEACEIINREWVGLSEDELDDIWDSHSDELGDVRQEDALKIAQAIEAKLKEKNHDSK